MENENTNIDTANNSEQPATDTPNSSEHGTSVPTQPQAEPQQPEIPEYTAEAAAALDAAYALSAPSVDENADPAQNSQSAIDNSQSSDDYTLTFPDTFAERPEAQAFSTILAPIAKESGIDGTAFGKLFADAYTAITDAQQRAEWQNRFQQDSDLKKDWGADYEANMSTARSHIAFLKERAGLTDDDLAVFASPKGMRALYAMATAHAAPPAAGLDTGTITEQTWARAVMQPDHADHDAFVNPMNPRYKEVNHRWLRANGQ